MASLAAVNSFAGLKVQSLKAAPAVRSGSRAAVVCSAAGSPWEKVGRALVATSAGFLVAASAANAVTVKLGKDDGSLEFVPKELTVAAGEKIVFTNNKGFPHNVVFDEDEVPAGVVAETISGAEYLNAPGETYEVALSTPGTYSAYCEPHQGAGMSIKITVK